MRYATTLPVGFEPTILSILHVYHHTVRTYHVMFQMLVFATHALLCCVIIVVLVSAPVPVVRIEPAIDRGVIGTEVPQVPFSHHPVDIAQFL